MYRTLAIPLLTVFVIGLTSALQASDPYVLGWEHRLVMAAPPNRTHVEGPPPPIGREELPKLARAKPIPLPRAERPTPLQEFNLQLTARHYFDYESDRYVTVEKVETIVYRRGRYPRTTVDENAGQLSEFEVILEGLQPGDRYQVRVTWDDDSSRTVERWVKNSEPSRLFFNEPLPYDSGFGGE